MIEEYWNEVFGKYKTDTGEFEIPGFPEPLMSAHFGVRNIIGAHGDGKKLWICEFDAVSSGDISITVEKLKDVGRDFWNYQSEYNSGAFPFIRRLVPFLNQLETPHFHLFLKDEKGICASSIAGESSVGVFLLNLFVREDKRGHGLAKLMTNETRKFFAGKKCFYWTIHQGFFFDSKVIDHSVCMVELSTRKKDGWEGETRTLDQQINSLLR